MMTQGWPRAETPEASSYLWCSVRVTNQLRMALRRAFEWIGMFERPAGFRYEISDFKLYIITLGLWIVMHMYNHHLSVYSNTIITLTRLSTLTKLCCLSNVTDESSRHVHHLVVYICVGLNHSREGDSVVCDNAHVNVRQCRGGTVIAAWAVGGTVSFHNYCTII